MSFYIGLSFLSNNEAGRKIPHGLLSAEARRVLSCFEGGNPAGIAIDDNGRPFLPGKRCDFSISHSGAMAAVSFVNGKERRTRGTRLYTRMTHLHTGCDIQIVKPGTRMEEIAELFFRAAERDYIFEGGQFDRNRFFEIWALKECFLKLRGFSVFDMASAPSFISAGGPDGFRFAFGETVSSPLSFYLYRLTGNTGERYYLAAAVEGVASMTRASPPAIRWFSQSFLPCRSIAEIKAAPSPAKTVSPNM